MFTTFIVQPLFNLLTFIYAIIPGHNFGLAIVIFTIVIRLLMWPLVKKQLHNSQVMRKLQPELKRIKKEAAGDRQKESLLVMELYKERGVSPFSSIGILIVQLPIFIGLYAGLRKIIDDPQAIIDFSYPFIQDLSWMQTLAGNINLFDETFLGLVDLKRAALEAGGTYWPAMTIVLASAVTQYYQSKQLMPVDKDARRLRDILRDAGKGAEADQSEVSAATGRMMTKFIPIMIFLVTVRIASALSLYWFVSGLVAMIQQARALKDEEVDIEATLHKNDPKTSAKASKKDETSAPAKSGRKKVKSKARVVSITNETSSTKTPSTSASQRTKKKAKKRRR